MINQGIVTLIDCIDRYDISKGIRFESYAYMRVRGGIIDLIRKQDWIPRRVRVNAKEINRTASELANMLGREPTQQEIADLLCIKQTTYSKYELGRVAIPIDALMTLADFYGVSLDYLAGRSDEKGK